VGLLKRLRGTPIVRHDREWGMVYSPDPPYEILQTKLIDFFTMQRLRRFARYWDLVGNSGNFVETTPLLWRDGSPFQGFMRFADWLYAQTKQTHSIALSAVARSGPRSISSKRSISRRKRFIAPCSATPTALVASHSPRATATSASPGEILTAGLTTSSVSSQRSRRKRPARRHGRRGGKPVC
jgi:hypothetical protein